MSQRLSQGTERFDINGVAAPVAVLGLTQSVGL